MKRLIFIAMISIATMKTYVANAMEEDEASESEQIEEDEKRKDEIYSILLALIAIWSSLK